MRYIAFLMASFILILTVYPCADVVLGEVNQHICSSDHNHQHKNNEEKEDGCSPFCHCNCCRVSVTIVAPYFMSFENIKEKISTKVNLLYRVNYNYDASYFIWHPPKMIA